MGFDALLAERKRPFPPLRLLGREVRGVVSWNMNDTCNYRCSYCSQRFMPERTYRLEDIEAYVRAFSQLPGAWEVKLSGGEPFQQPGLDEIVAGLVKQGHLISVQTNFSASERKLLAFLEASKGALCVFAASLHLEYATPEAFIERHKLLAPYLQLGATFCVTSVARPGRVRHLHDEVWPKLRDAGIVFKVQPEKLHSRLVAYDDDERALLLAMGGHNQTGDVAPNFRGRLCYAGANYLVIKSNGEAYRCYPASRTGGTWARLGSLLEGLTLLDEPKLCPYTHCHCTVPIHRGMIQGVKPAEQAWDGLDMA
jgi:MoaA/NifB/PqqE/SkfB family radical SAM enzyme